MGNSNQLLEVKCAISSTSHDYYSIRQITDIRHYLVSEKLTEYLPSITFGGTMSPMRTMKVHFPDLIVLFRSEMI